MRFSMSMPRVLGCGVMIASVLAAHHVKAEEELYFSREPTRGGSSQQYEQGLEMIRDNTRGLRKEPVRPASRPAEEAGPTALSVYFGFDSYELSPGTRRELDLLGNELAKEKFSQSGDRWLIEGHTDATGSRQYNQRLSERRAISVVDYLVTRHGVSPGILDSIGRGEDDLYDDRDPTSAVNRRVRIKYVGE